ncbi:hypothetical protein [Salinibacter grassmerensis]|uniref:hypothetical protein n=1 Tax=Salinibacter grassmerensis TaxID=3040353 RepID=UPI0021E6EB2C|nr:hypothetical protein [Salinibacter grassmerensis]
MKRSWLPALLVGGALLVSLTACSDSSDVGLGVGSDPLRGGDPVTLDVTPTLDTTRTAPVTGDNARERPPSQDAWRFLVGSVNDPTEGTGVLETQGYVDFAGRSSFPSEIASADPSSLTAELRLTTDYFHGYSTESMDVEVYDLTSEAEMDSARATAIFDADPSPVSVDTATINPSDSLVTIRLQESWVSGNIGTLRSTGNDGADFEDAFHGFRIVMPNSEAVVGFSSSTAALRLRTVSSSDTTTADYPGLKTFTHIEQTGAGDPPPGYRLVQDGIGTRLEMEWDFDTNPLDSLESAPLNRAEIFVPNDTSALGTSSGFERSQPQGYRIVAARASGAPSCSAVRSVVVSDANRTCALPLVPSAAPAAALVPDNVSSPTFQQSLRRVRNGQPPVFTTFRVSVADRENTSVNRAATVQPGLPTTLPALVPVDGTEPGPPRATLTVTPL